MHCIYYALLLHVGQAVVYVEKTGDEGGVEGDLAAEDVLQVVQLLLHAVDVQVKVLLADLPVQQQSRQYEENILTIEYTV